MTLHINAPLTPKELEVFRYIAEGKRDTEIASILGISPHSVRGRVHDAVLRVGAETRCHALAMLIRDHKI